MLVDTIVLVEDGETDDEAAGAEPGAEAEPEAEPEADPTPEPEVHPEPALEPAPEVPPALPPAEHAGAFPEDVTELPELIIFWAADAELLEPAVDTADKALVVPLHCPGVEAQT
jgi:hypothetical protein